ncbi:YtxH domain-containing protein [Weizmannia acidilactici]|uniref:YtxH domain-containing protein n=1 Tax=Weizmannia acidilactici TaxID=2607726 RepID=UPI0020A4400C|nr:YtxH domain-containing protein [Weizmannia acidilactici]
MLILKKASLIYGLLVGGTAGAVSVLLTTPASGKKIRAALINNSGAFIESAKKIALNVKELKDSIQELSTEGKKAVAEVMDDIKQFIKEWQRSIEPNKDALQNEIKEIQKTIENLEKQLQQKSS